MRKELGSLAAHRAYLGLPPKKGPVTPFPCRPSAVFAKQVAGLARRLKAIRCRDVVIGLSGGLDSTLALLVAHAAFERLGYDQKGLHVLTMPGFGTSSRTKGNADRLCEGLGLRLETISVAKSVRQHLKDIGHDGKTPDVTYENAQARMRTLILMDRANMVNGIVLGTGDLSEIALGWCTFNGDHMSMFGVNAGVPKTVVRQVCAWWVGEEGRRNKEEGRSKREEERGKRDAGGRKTSEWGTGEAAVAVQDIIDTPISPELVKGQVTEDRIGPYELHDFFLWNFIMNEMGPADLQASAERHFAGRFDAATVARTLRTFMTRFFTQAFKRNCAPDGIRVFPFELSLRGWWIPSDLGIPRPFAGVVRPRGGAPLRTKGR